MGDCGLQGFIHAARSCAWTRWRNGSPRTPGRPGPRGGRHRERRRAEADVRRLDAPGAHAVRSSRTVAQRNRARRAARPPTRRTPSPRTRPARTCPACHGPARARHPPRSAVPPRPAAPRCRAPAQDSGARVLQLVAGLGKAAEVIDERRGLGGGDAHLVLRLPVGRHHHQRARSRHALAKGLEGLWVGARLHRHQGRAMGHEEGGHRRRGLAAAQHARHAGGRRSLQHLTPIQVRAHLARAS